MSTTTFLIIYLTGMSIYLFIHRPPRAPQLKRKARAHIHTVTDLRLGIEHPRRNDRGHFITHKGAAYITHLMDRELFNDMRECVSTERRTRYGARPRMSYRAKIWGLIRVHDQIKPILTLPF